VNLQDKGVPLLNVLTW